eukprot:1161678-Pelagomonas_calceolata.AAC.7
MSRQLTMSTRAHSIDSWDSRSLADNMAGKMGLSSQGEERTHRVCLVQTISLWREKAKGRVLLSFHQRSCFHSRTNLTSFNADGSRRPSSDSRIAGSALGPEIGKPGSSAHQPISPGDRQQVKTRRFS